MQARRRTTRSVRHGSDQGFRPPYAKHSFGSFVGIEDYDRRNLPCDRFRAKRMTEPDSNAPSKAEGSDEIYNREAADEGHRESLEPKTGRQRGSIIMPPDAE